MKSTDYTYSPYMPSDCGVYRFTFSNGKFYVGSSYTMKRKRWPEHTREMTSGRHCNDFVRNCYKKYGAPIFEVILICRPIDLIFYEQQVIDTLKPQLNLSKIAGRPEHTDEVRQKMRAVQLGKKATPETRAKISRAGKGRSKSPEHRAKIGAGNLGRIMSEKAKEALKKRNTGRKHSLEHRAKNSAANKGKPHSPEHRLAVMKAKWPEKYGHLP